MARDDSRAQVQRVTLMLLLDGRRPSGAVEWVSPVVPGLPSTETDARPEPGEFLVGCGTELRPCCSTDGRRDPWMHPVGYRGWPGTVSRAPRHFGLHEGASVL
jgi:hypothetical protein